MFFSFFYIFSIILTMGCSDWFLIWVGLEINMMSFIILVYERSCGGVELCMKYFFIQSIGSGILMMMFYCEFWLFEYVILGVLSYKIGGGPFFFWFPSVCNSLGWGGCLFLMTFQKFLPLMLMSFLVSMFLWMIIMTSIGVGAIGSFNQKSLKRLMAYSSIHHVGWVLLGNFVGNNLWFIYLVMYSLLILGVFMSLWKDKILEVGTLWMMSSKWSFVMGMLSMGGMPPMLGFYLKWWLFYNLLWVDKFLLFIMVIMSVLMFYVYLRIVYMVLMGSMFMWGWGLLEGSKMHLNADLIFMMGLNISVIVWFIL